MWGFISFGPVRSKPSPLCEAFCWGLTPFPGPSTCRLGRGGGEREGISIDIDLVEM